MLCIACPFVQVRPEAEDFVSVLAGGSETISPKASLIGLEEFSDLVQRHEAMVFRMLARLTGEREELEDLAQEVFLRLFRALPHFQGRAKVSTFLYRIIVNVVNDEWIRRKEARRMTPIDDEAHELAYNAPGPGDLLERKQVQQAIEAALEQLEFRDRTVLALHYQEGRSYKEIAAVLELPMGTVKTHLHRSRERLKAAMGEWISRCKTKY
jgi:RNA polymerase sigma-70 factor, ECF subfamily